MEDAGFSADELIALLAAHSVARQHTVNPTFAVGLFVLADGGETVALTDYSLWQDLPLDSTPHKFDSQFFVEVRTCVHHHAAPEVTERTRRRCPKVLPVPGAVCIKAKRYPRLRISFVCSQTIRYLATLGELRSAIAMYRVLMGCCRTSPTWTSLSSEHIDFCNML